MAEPYDIRHDPETGQEFVRLPGADQYVPATPEQVDILEESGPIAFVNALGNSLGQAVTGGFALAGAPGAREAFGEYAANQEFRSAGAPVAAFTGSIAPDVAIGAATGGGGTLLRQAARVGGTEALLGAVRNPDDPLRGAAIQGGAGLVAGPVLGMAAGPTMRAGTRRGLEAVQPVIDRSRQALRGPQRPPDGVAFNPPRNLSAAAADDVSFETTERALAGFLEPEELAELSQDLNVGPLTTRGDDLALRARGGTDELDRAENIRQSEELYRSDVVTDRIAGGGRSINAIRDNAQEAATRVVMRELGEPVSDRLTNQTINRIGAALGREFDEAAEAAGNLKFEQGDLDALNNIRFEAVADDARLVDAEIEKIVSDLEKASETTGPSGELSMQAAQQARTRLGDKIQKAAKAGNFTRAQSLGEVQDVLDAIVDRQLPADVADNLAEARYKYRIYKALQRNTSTTDAGGKLNLISFNRSMERMGNRSYRLSGRSEAGEKFGRTMETLEYLTSRIEPSSGTAQRLLAKIPGGATGGGLVGAGILGGAALSE